MAAAAAAAREASAETRLIALFILLLFLSVLEASDDAKPYSCCPSPQIRFDRRCEHQWIINGQTIAWSRGEQERHMAPCTEIEDGLMRLDRCVNLNVTITCNNQGVAAEQRVRYHGELCPTPISGGTAPGSRGSAPLLLAALTLLLIR